jgi:hypothetical protein
MPREVVGQQPIHCFEPTLEEDLVDEAAHERLVSSIVMASP